VAARLMCGDDAMRITDVTIVGGGLAGSLAAAMLGRAGVDAVLVDPHEVYPPDFRCEKLDGVQVAILRKTGLADEVLRAATPDRECWVARFGRLLDKRPGDQYGIFYAPLVNTVRSLVPPCVPMIAAKATAIATAGERQTVALSNGETISARLVVLANGLNMALRKSLGLTCKVLSECHSVSIGFDIKPIGGRAFEFPALTYYAEHVTDETALITLFPIGAAMRANLFVYRTMQDRWLKAMRDRPEQTLRSLMPGLRTLTGDFEVASEVQIRPVDLYATGGVRRAGLVLVGDAFATSCPAAGTGARKAINDIERLCNVHIPRWLATPGMDASKIAGFYDDRVKRACDEASFAKAFDLRAFSLDPSWWWQTKRRVKFLGQYAVGALRRLHRKFNRRTIGRVFRQSPAHNRCAIGRRVRYRP
jgi:2-polyprenyl-6-methoxyphenol hydroxylase-like FAD-dependent oxidoreductase